MPQIETRVVLVQEAGKHEELLKALEVCVSEVVFLLSLTKKKSTEMR